MVPAVAGNRATKLWIAPSVLVQLVWVLGVVPLVAADRVGPNDLICRTGSTNGPAMDLPEGTRRMVARLAEIQARAATDAVQNPFLASELAGVYQGALEKALASGNAAGALELRPKLALQLLNAGQNEAALQQFELFRGMVQAASWRLDTRQSTELAIRTAVAYLRIGEQQNCLGEHNPDSCLFPIRDGGIHRRTRGVLGALRVLERHLGQVSDDLRARWLLNIAHMALGTYPADVPTEWLIPPTAFVSEADFPRLPDVAGEAGVDVDDIAGGVVVEDFDGDGWLDLMVSSSSLSGQLRLFQNRGDGRFDERTHEARLAGLLGGLNLVSTDYDNDGWVDVLVLRGAWLGRAGHHPNSLLRNRGDGTFEDVTEAAGLLSFHPTQTAAWLDFDSDGFLDVFIGNESTPEDPHPCELFRNNGNGTFTECAAACGLDVRQFIKAVVAGDYNGDGRPDLYLSNGRGPNLLFRNDGASSATVTDPARWRFTEVAPSAGVTEPARSFPTWFWDYDNDGWLDLFVSGYGYRDVGDVAADYLGLPHQATLPRLYRNRGDGTFEDVTRAARLNRVLLAMGSNFGDLDNDGWLDFYVGTGDPDLATLIPNRLFRNEGGQRFHEITTAAGVGHLQKGHGVAFADFDNDGDQDVYLVVGGALPSDHYPNALFRNPGFGNHWLTLRLEGVRSHRAALGARIRVELETETGPRSVYRVVGTGGSFGASPLRQEMGLGSARSIRWVEIHWPSGGIVQRFEGLAMDRFYRLREGDPEARPLPARSFQLGRRHDSGGG
ncbi:MAG: CRTAC1 family protein [Verrucomicrobiales bacterium]|nr:CRTAC1 family protein [Verrucomicrobiales bacterium]